MLENPWGELLKRAVGLGHVAVPQKTRRYQGRHVVGEFSDVVTLLAGSARGAAAMIVELSIATYWWGGRCLNGTSRNG